MHHTTATDHPTRTTRRGGRSSPNSNKTRGRRSRSQSNRSVVGGSAPPSSSSSPALGPRKHPDPDAGGGVRTFAIHTDFTDVRSLGQSGTYGAMFAAKLTDDDRTPVILKRYVNYDESEGINDDILKEVLLLQHLNAYPDTKTVRLYGVAFGDNLLYLVLEPLIHDLRHLMTGNIRLDREQRRVVLYKVLHAFNAIHQLGIVHNDIKPANIMILRTAHSPDAYDVRIIDFGLADFIGIGPTRRMARHYISTEIYKAPDDRNTRAVYRARNGAKAPAEWKYHEGNRKSYVSDVYSIAVTIINVCFRSDFGVQYHGDEIYIDGKPDDCMASESRFGADGLDLLRKMLCQSTRTRVTCAQALQHPYFAGLDRHLSPLTMAIPARGGGVDFSGLVARHEGYTRDDYAGSAHELAYLEETHRHYRDDVIPRGSTVDDRATRGALVRWLVEMLVDEPREYPDYPLRLQLSDRSDGLPVCIFETLDVVLNGAALAASVIESGLFLDSPQLIGLVACHIYATVFEYLPTDVAALLRRCDRPHTDAAFHDCCIRMLQYCDARCPIRPVWLHLQYTYLKLKYESDGVFATFVDERLLARATAWICEYYTAVACPPDEFTVYQVVQYSVTRALAELTQVDVEWLAGNAHVAVLHSPHFASIHAKYRACE